MDYEDYEGLGRVTKKDYTRVLCTYTWCRLGIGSCIQILSLHILIEPYLTQIYIPGDICSYTLPADRPMPSA